MAGEEELDPAFRGPAPGWEPGDPRQSGRYTPWETFAGSSTANLDQLARARVKPTFGPYAYGSNMYKLALETGVFSRSQLAAHQQYEKLVQRDAFFADLDRVNASEEADLKRKLAEQAIEDRRAKEKAQKTKALAADIRRSTRAASGEPLADLLGQIGVNLVLDIEQRKAAAKRRRNILRVGRRGAAATRSPPATNVYANPGRTGAKSTRSTTTTAPATARKAGGQLGKPPIVAPTSVPQLPRSVDSTLPPETRPTSTRSEAPSASKSPTSQQSGSRSVLQFPQLPSWLQVGLPALAGLGLASRAGARARVRAPARTPARAPTRPRSPELDLTPFNGSLLGSAQLQGQCSCPKPPRDPKRKKARAPSCTNPLISRTEKDGILTIKRELKCPPSKSKSRSVRPARTPTSSPVPPSSTLAAGLLFPWG